jgi:Beta-mannanase
MKKLMAIAACAAMLAGCCSKPAEAPKHSEAAETLLKALQECVDEGKVMYGHQDDLNYGHDWRIADDDMSMSRSDVLDVCGSYPAIIGVDMGGIELGDTKNLDSNYFYHNREAIVTHYMRGGIPTISWHPRNPLTGGDAWDISSDQVVASIIDGGENHENFMGWLCNMADFIESCKTPAGDLVPIIFRPWHEHTGTWFWWGEGVCTPEQFQALWDMTYNYLTVERGLDNLVWAYSPNAGAGEEGLMARYPGDGECDIIGLDCYSGSLERPEGMDDEKWQEVLSKLSSDFTVRMKEGLDILQAAAAEHGKVLAITETGFEGIKDGTWWTETLLPAISGYPAAYLLTWRNAPYWEKAGHWFAGFPGFEFEADFKAFCNDSRIKMLE